MSANFETAMALSWGRVLRAPQQSARPMWRRDLPAMVRWGAARENGVLGEGLGRSYGDTGLNPHGAAILMTGLDRLIAFDPATRRLRAEAGMSLADILRFLIPKGFFLPVTPGTRQVTLGGAIANDVHGKNHHRAGSFGSWVRALGLLRGDGEERVLTPDTGDGLFEATAGGLGLTGLIAWAEIEVLPIATSLMDIETIPFAGLPEFFALSRESDSDWDYTVSWIDCLGAGGAGRGLFSRANHAKTGPLSVDEPRRFAAIPFEAPGFLFAGGATIKAFNAAYYALGRSAARYRPGPRTRSYQPFFYPLDAIRNWNLLYGRRGFFQYQSVVPPENAEAATAEMLKQISVASEGSFLAVLKRFGAKPSPGLLSFPREGTSLALDFPNRGASTLALLSRLDDVVREAQGRLYPAKDGRMDAAMFRAGYPALEEFEKHVDPGFSSSFWRRMQMR